MIEKCAISFSIAFTCLGSVGVDMSIARQRPQKIVVVSEVTMSLPRRQKTIATPAINISSLRDEDPGSR